MATGVDCPKTTSFHCESRSGFVLLICAKTFAHGTAHKAYWQGSNVCLIPRWVTPSSQGGPGRLSPHFFGWPCSRGRLYTVGFKKSTFTDDSVADFGLSGLFMQPVLPVSAFLTAPKASGRARQDVQGSG